MKDVVERYCDADEEEITTQQPIPLYLGLMGTMVGIIIIGVIYNGMNLLRISSYLQTITKGLLILIAVMLVSNNQKIKDILKNAAEKRTGKKLAEGGASDE